MRIKTFNSQETSTNSLNDQDETQPIEPTTEDIMRLPDTNVSLSYQEAGNYIFNILEQDKKQELENLIKLINKYNSACEAVINKSQKALIILGKDKNHSNIIADFLKTGELKVADESYENWAFTTSPRQKLNSLDSFNTKTETFLTYKSTFLNNDSSLSGFSILNNSSLSESAVDKFLLQKILSTLPTKFILTIKNINTREIVQEFIDIFKKFIPLLENIKIYNYNLSMVVTDVPDRKKVESINEVIKDVIKQGNFSNNQKDIINKMTSIYLLPEPSKEAEQYKDLLSITYDTNYIYPNENNKIIVDDENSKFILNSINVVNEKIKVTIPKLEKAILERWREEKNTVFKYLQNNPNLNHKTVLPAPDNLKKLIDVINNYKNIDDSNKTIGIFLEVVKELYQILEIPSAKNELKNFLDYLKHIFNITLSNTENLDLINPSEWFDSLFSKLTRIDIKQELLESFKNTIQEDTYSFYNKLNESIKEFYEDIKNNNIINSQAVNNICELKDFLEYIHTRDINNLNDIKSVLKGIFKYLPNINNISPITTTITNSISNLEELIGSVTQEEVNALWKYIITSETITEISQNIDAVIYNKLLHNQILPNQELHTYALLEKLLTTSHESNASRIEEEELYRHQLGKVYCQKAKCYAPNKSTKLYKESITFLEKAAKLGSAEANIKLGRMEFDNGDYYKAREYFKNTTYISYMKDSFEKLFDIKKSKIKNEIQKNKTEDIVKSTLELVELCLDQVEFYKKYEIKELVQKTLTRTKTIYLDTIAKLEEGGSIKDYETISKMYYGLAEITSTPYTQHEFIKQAQEYSNLVNAFNSSTLESQDIATTTSTSYDDPNFSPNNRAYSPFLGKLDYLNSNNNKVDIRKPFYLNSNEDSNSLLGYGGSYELEKNI